MAITLNCPQCQNPVIVGPELAGTQVLCPHCRRRLVIPREFALIAGSNFPAGQATPQIKEDTACSTESSVESVPPSGQGHNQVAGDTPSPPPPPPRMAKPRQQPPASSAPVAKEGSSSEPVQPPTTKSAPKPPEPPPKPAGVGTPGGATDSAAPPQLRKVPRLVITDLPPEESIRTTESQLPQLHLADSETSQPEVAQSRGVHPLVLLAVLSLSMLTSLALLFVEPAGSLSSSEKKERAWYRIEMEYFSDLDSPSPKERYQVLLREARRAELRGDREKAVELCREVLRMLRAERGRFDNLTGSLGRDKQLEELLTVIIGDP